MSKESCLWPSLLFDLSASLSTCILERDTIPQWFAFSFQRMPAFHEKTDPFDDSGNAYILSAYSGANHTSGHVQLAYD